MQIYDIHSVQQEKEKQFDKTYFTVSLKRTKSFKTKFQKMEEQEQERGC